MNFYKLGHVTHEETYFIVLTHQEKYSKQEFEDICFNAIERILTEKIGEHIRKFSNPEFDQLIYTLRDLLLQEYGFDALEKEGNFVLSGWSNTQKSWDEFECDLDKRVRQISLKVNREEKKYKSKQRVDI